MEQLNDGPNLDHLFEALAKSPFRRRFKLLPLERSYLAEKGLPTVLGHARDFIAKRLASAIPANDGKQTPFRGHPVFLSPSTRPPPAAAPALPNGTGSRRQARLRTRNRVTSLRSSRAG
jgi:Domain of unknown function (DUF4186)